MYKFGANPARSLESFGVAGLLGEDCRVYYDSLFSSRNVGRLGDLISALLRSQQTDEIRIRALILFTFMAAYRAQASATEGHRDAPVHSPLPDPIALELGLDNEKIALSFSFVPGGFLSASGVPQGALAETLARLRPYADRIVVRVEAGKRVELVMLIGIPGKMKVEAEKDRPEASMVQVPPGASAPKPAQYIQLGDIDYSRLLAGVEPGQRLEHPSPGEMMAQGSNELADALRSRKKSHGAEKIVIQGKTGDLQDQTEFRVESTPEVEKPDTTNANEALLRPYRERIEQLQRELESLRNSSGRAIHGGVAVQQAASAIGGLFRKVWSGKSAQPTPEPASSPAQAEEEVIVVKAGATSAAHSESAGDRDDDEVEVENQGGKANTEVEAKSFMTEIEEGSLDRTVKRAQEEVGDIKKDIQSARAKRWVEGLMTDLVAEKARLRELAKRLTSTMRQKEMEFKGREIALQEELKRRDEMLKQKNTALARGKEQMSQMTLTMEKLRSTAEKSDEVGTKAKLMLTQKLLAGSKDEVTRLTQKVDDLKDQLAAAQLQSSKRPVAASSSTELSAMKVKYERAVRQSEELRVMNEQLTDRIQTLMEKKDDRRGGESSDSGKKLDAAVKQLGTFQKENDQLKLRLEEMQREETRLKMELKRAQTDMKNLKVAVAAQRNAAAQAPKDPKGGEGGSSAA